MNVKTTRTLGKLITLSLITSTVLHATNGDNLIAVGTKARGINNNHRI
jgi:long-chain fatty acid transport protein